MKNILLITFVICSFFVGCKKTTDVALSSVVFGTWELRTQYGGVVGILQFPPGSGNTLQFNKDSTFAQYSSFMLTNHGTFHVIKNAYTILQIKYDGIYYNNSSNGQALMQGLKDSLVIGSVTSALSAVYVRQ